MNKLLKGFLYFVVGCALVGVIIGYMVGSFPAFSYMARGFLIAVSKNQFEQAYGLLSLDFQKRNDFPTFTNNVRMSGLDQYATAQWEKDVLSPDQKSGYVVGKVNTKQNKKITVRFQFIKMEGKDWQDNGWRIDNITFPQDEQQS